MEPFILGTIVIIFLLILVGAVVFFYAQKNGKKHETDYRTFFIIGISWLPLGIALDMPVFTIMGIVFMILGLKNKDKWKEGKEWDRLNFGEQKRVWILIGLLGLLFVVAIGAYLAIKSGMITLS